MRNNNYNWTDDIAWYVKKYVENLPSIPYKSRGVTKAKKPTFKDKEIAKVIFRDLLEGKANEDPWTKKNKVIPKLLELAKDGKIPVISSDKERALGMDYQRIVKACEGKSIQRSGPFISLNQKKFKELIEKRNPPIEISENPRLDKLREEKEFESGKWHSEVKVDGKRIDAVCIKNGIHWIIEENGKLDHDTFGEVIDKADLYAEQKGIKENNIKKAIVCKIGDASIEKSCIKQDIKVFKYLED
jgi:hypothetical protein